jgi:hypothetical protein
MEPPDTLADLLERLSDDELAQITKTGTRHAERLARNANSADHAWAAVFAYLATSAEVALVRRSTGTKVLRLARGFLRRRAACGVAALLASGTEGQRGACPCKQGRPVGRALPCQPPGSGRWQQGRHRYPVPPLTHSMSGRDGIDSDH